MLGAKSFVFNFMQRMQDFMRVALVKMCTKGDSASGSNSNCCDSQYYYRLKTELGSSKTVKTRFYENGASDG